MSCSYWNSSAYNLQGQRPLSWTWTRNLGGKLCGSEFCWCWFPLYLWQVVLALGPVDLVLKLPKLYFCHQSNRIQIYSSFSILLFLIFAKTKNTAWLWIIYKNRNYLCQMSSKPGNLARGLLGVPCIQASWHHTWRIQGCGFLPEEAKSSQRARSFQNFSPDNTHRTTHCEIQFV